MKKVKRLKILGIEIILSGENIIFDSETNLKDELGFWEENKIYIYKEGLNTLQKFGIFIHEFVEFILEKKFHLPHNLAHFIANIFEFILTFGKAAEQVW
ncbi:MAG: hypothetical protein ABIN15_05270 [candidate division WOR-3 bacterium]